MSAEALAADQPVTARFAITGVPSAQLLSRLLEGFAQQDMLPRSVVARSTADEMEVEIEQPGLMRHRAELIAEKMRVMVLVESVGLVCESEPG